MNEKVAITIKNLIKNNMDAFYVETSDEAINTLKTILKKGSSVAVGGSVTLDELGVLDILRNGDYLFFDRYAATTPEERKEAFRKAFLADYFICSSNAITENGELYNVDGTANRISALLYGPDNVIIIAGVNKIVKNLKEAELRVKTIAAPKNTVRLGIDTYCKTVGHCVALDTENKEMCSGCNSPNRICRNFLVSAAQAQKGRIKVILVNENLGY